MTSQIPPISLPVSHRARLSLDRRLQNWEEGQALSVSVIVADANQGLSEVFPRDEIVAIVKTYSQMGWIETTVDEQGELVITSLSAIYAEQSDLLRGEGLQRRHDADENRARLSSQRIELKETIDALGLSPDDKQETLKLALARHGIGVVQVMFNAASWGHTAFFRHISDSEQKLVSGFGGTEEEAICHAGAKCYRYMLEKQGQKPDEAH